MDEQPVVAATRKKTTPTKKVTTHKSNAKEISAKKPISSRVVDKIKTKKPKLVRGNFAMPETEYQVLSDIKKVCLKAGIKIKKSELLRIGVAMLSKMAVQKISTERDRLTDLDAVCPKK